MNEFVQNVQEFSLTVFQVFVMVAYVLIYAALAVLLCFVARIHLLQRLLNKLGIGRTAKNRQAFAAVIEGFSYDENDEEMARALRFGYISETQYGEISLSSPFRYGHSLTRDVRRRFAESCMGITPRMNVVRVATTQSCTSRS